MGPQEFSPLKEAHAVIVHVLQCRAFVVLLGQSLDPVLIVGFGIIAFENEDFARVGAANVFEFNAREERQGCVHEAQHEL